jgi:transposase-like protein
VLAVSAWWRQREDVLFAQGPPRCSLDQTRGGPPGDAGGIVIMVGSDPDRVESDLAAGVVACPGCGGWLARWGFARRRSLRGEAGPVVVRPRRGRCRSCGSTHVLLPDVALARRVDVVAVIGRAVTAAGSGLGHRKVAERVGRPWPTVRSWLRRFQRAAMRIVTHFGAWAYRLDANLAAMGPAGSPLADALEAIGVAARAASLRFGSRPPWSWASVLTVGRLLSNTNTPWLAP